MKPKYASFFNYLLCLIAGALMPLSLAPWNLWPISIFSLAVLFFRLSIETGKSFWYVAAFNAGLFGVGVSWLKDSASVFGFDASFGLILTATFVVFISLLFAMPYLLLPYLRRSASLTYWYFVLPAFWFLSEWFRGWVLSGFPWLYIGYGYLNSALSGWAPVIGVMGVGYVVSATASTIACFYYHVLRSKTLLVTPLALFIGLIWVAGFALTKITWTKPYGELRNAAIIQANVSAEDKWDPEKREAIYNNLKSLSSDYWSSADLIIWPEVALPAYLHEAKPFIDDVRLQALANDVLVITGAAYIDQSSKDLYNSVYAFGNAEKDGLYHKRHPVPLSEFVPFYRTVRKIGARFGVDVSAVQVGEGEVSPFLLGELRVSSSVCYDFAFGQTIARDARARHVLVNVSNDGWLGEKLGPSQHLQIARFRALETGRSVLRATTSGISAFIDHTGQVYRSTPQYRVVTAQDQFQPRTGSTPYMLFLNYPMLVFTLLSLVLYYLHQRIVQLTDHRKRLEISLSNNSDGTANPS